MLPALLVALLWALAAPSADAARVTAAYGIRDGRTLEVTAAPRGAGGELRAVLETRGRTYRKGGKTRRRKAQVRVVKPVRRGQARLRWRVPRRGTSVTVRVRVTQLRGKRRTVARGAFKTIRTKRLRRGASLARVRPSTVAALPAPGQPGQLVLNGPQKVRRGQVIALGIAPNTPQGLLVRAQSVSRAGAQTVVATRPATIPEVVPEGELDVASPPQGVAQSRATKVDRPFVCTNGVLAQASGTATLTSGVRFKSDWSWRLGRSPQVSARFEGEANAALNAQASVSAEASCTLARQQLFPQAIPLGGFATSIGPVPIVGTYSGQVYLSGSAGVEGRIDTSASASLGATAGVEYRDAKFKPFGKLTRQVQAQPPTISATANAEAALAPAVSVKFYGTAGPELDVSAGTKLVADAFAPAGQPWWRLTMPLSVGVRMRLDAWKLSLASDRFQVWSEELELAKAQTGAPGTTVTDLGPSPDPLPRGIKTRLVWDSTSDVDLHTWDEDGDHAYFADQYAIDGGYLDQDVIPGYGPETYRETSSGATLTFGVCQYSGRAANVTVDVRDASGETRRLNVRLVGRKAAAMLAVSPPGGTPYEPTEPWCAESGDPTRLGQTTTGGAS